ncbi:CAP domain-containing protein [Saccharomonospora azurea]|uniref:CAP domain-containing protein n=1 Tax=Saccharomonospora azurea TaxID=40988 RepID=UPI0020D22352|nr:CAP domain-containing protein [Saccharomonospora azurea]
MFASVLVGVAVAVGGHLLWSQPDPDDTRVVLASEPPNGSPGGAEAGGVSTSTQSTTSTTPSDEPTPPPAAPTTDTTTSAPDVGDEEPSTSSQDPSPPSDPADESSSPDSSSADDAPLAPPAPATSGERRTGTADREVVDLVNAERAEAGCSAVRVDQRLVAAAQDHSDDMAAGGYLSHTSRDGRSFSDRIEAAGYPSPAAENIAMGMSSAEAVMEAWMSSDGHRRNILNCDITAIGVGLNPDGWYWTQNFGY